MGGEVLFEAVDRVRFDECVAVFAELDGGRRLSARSRAVLLDAAGRPFSAAADSRRLRSALKRVLLAPEIDPRTFLSPYEVDEAVLEAVNLVCRSGGADWGGQEIGDHWVLLDGVQRDLLRFPWFDTLRFSDDRELSQAMPYPARGELRSHWLTDRGLRQLTTWLDELPPGWTTHSHYRSVVEALRDLTAAVGTRPGWSLSVTVLL